MKKLILASTSPRRVELMQNIGLVFETISPDYDENLIGLKFSYEAIENIALNKALSIKNSISHSALIISADTVVVMDDEILGKPKDRETAINMLKKLNDTTHKVVTSIAIIDIETGRKAIESTTSEVTFNNLNEKDIYEYIDNFKPYDKAGSYGIQELPQIFVKNINGEFDNIMGLPTQTLIKMIKKINNQTNL